jgi:uncharacterized membrane protein
MRLCHFLLAALSLWPFAWALETPAQSAVSQIDFSHWVYPSPITGRLLYQPDAQGNHIVDNSGVGYMGGTVPIPDVPTVMTISPVPGDNTANIQNALNAIAAMTPDSNGFRGALLLTAGTYDISNTFSINASGIVLRGVGNCTNGTIIYSTSTNGPGNGAPKSQVQGVIVISGSYSPIPINGTYNNIVDNYVPVGARSFTVDGGGVLNVGDQVVVHRPSTANWITAIGMDSNYLSTPWAPGTVDVDEQRVITRIEGNRVMIDQPITTALDQNYGGGSVYAYTWPQQFTQIGIENLRGVSTYDTNNIYDEDHAWTFIRFSDAQNFWVRNVVSQYFGKTCVSVQNGSYYGTVENCQCLTPISLIEDERRYAFDINSCSLCIVNNCYTSQDRHQFITESLTDGPNVFLDGLGVNAYDVVGTHVMWASGILFDNITSDNGIWCVNNGNAGAAGDPGQGWTGANCTFWNNACGTDTNGFAIEAPPTAHNWLIGGIGPQVAAGGSGLQGPGTYDSLQTNVFPNSLYYAQLQDHIAEPELQQREYRIGAINLFTSNNPVSLDTTWSNTVRTAASGEPLNNFGVATNGQWVPFTFNFLLASNEQIVAATLELSMLAGTNNDTNDVLYLGSLTNSFLFSNLGWLPLSTVKTNPTVKVLDLSSQLGLLAGGQLNVALQSDAGVDWAELDLQVAPILTTFTNVLTPTDDATVRGGIYATNNFGGLATLTVNQASLPNNEQTAYLRWNLGGITGTILQARVQLVPINVASTNIEQGVTFADTNTWDESSITWSNQPGGGRRFATWIPQPNVPVQFVIPPQLMNAITEQSNQLNLELYSIHNVGVLGSVDYASSEYPNPALRPQLFLVISNTAPTISGLTNITIFQDSSTGPIFFNIGDAETPNSLTVAASSGNTTLLPNQNMVFGGASPNPTLTLTPAPGQTGCALISAVVTDPGGLTDTDNFTLTVLPYTNASFVVSASPASQTVPAGNGASYSVNLVATNGNFSSNVVLSVSGLPQGTSGNFSPPNVDGTGSSTLNISVATNTPGGTYTLQIIGTGGGLTRSTTVTLNVAGFLLLATPASQNIPTNGIASYNIGIIYTNSYAGNVTFSLGPPVPGVIPAFVPWSVNSSSNSTLTLAASSTPLVGPPTPPGIYSLTINATDGTLFQSADITLNVFNLSISAFPGSVSMTTSAGNGYTVAVDGTPGISNIVALSVAGLPAGATANFLPSTVAGSGNTALSISTALTTPPGNYNLTISAASGTLTNSTTVGLTVTDFGISASPPSPTVIAGTGTNFTTTINSINGFGDQVNFSVTGLPLNATAGFSPSYVDGSGSSMLTVMTSTNTPPGTYILTITGTDGTLEHSTNVTLKVAGFTISSSPTSRTVTSGQSANPFTLTITSTNGYANNIYLALSGLPPGATASMSSTDVTGSASVTLTLSTSNSTLAGVYPLTVTATSGNIVLTASPTLKVEDFSLAAAPASQSVTAGVGDSYSVAITYNNTFTGNVNLSVSGLPANTAASFSPATVTNTGFSTLSITTSNTTPGGSYNLTITGILSGGTLTRTTNVTLYVFGLTNSFSLNTTPTALTMNPGSSNNCTAIVGGAVGFTNTVNLAVSGVPAGVNAFFYPPSITNGNGSSLLAIIASNSVTPGVYTLTNIGTSGSISQTNMFTLNIFSFSLAISPTSSRSVVASGSTTYTITATGTSGITNDVILSVSSLPANSTGSFTADPMIVTNTGTSTLDVTTATNTPAGNYTVTVTGVFGTLTNTVSSTLKVQDFSIVATPVSQTVMAGASSTNFTVTVGAINNFTENVAFTASGLPSGATPAFNPASFNGAGSTLVTISTGGSTASGTYTVYINGISGGLTHSTNITFIITSANSPPTLAAIPNQDLNVGVTLIITNVATDSSTPPPTLSFGLLNSPTGATLTAASGIFNFRPAVAQANTTNLTTVDVTASGTPPLSATQSFYITVNPLILPKLSVQSVTNGIPTLRVSGTQGPDFTMQASSNLVNWTAQFATNTPALPFVWTDTNANNLSVRFYRALIGP